MVLVFGIGFGIGFVRVGCRFWVLELVLEFVLDFFSLLGFLHFLLLLLDCDMLSLYAASLTC
jgi:hypothetical protein